MPDAGAGWRDDVQSSRRVQRGIGDTEVRAGGRVFEKDERFTAVANGSAALAGAVARIARAIQKMPPLAATS